MPDGGLSPCVIRVLGVGGGGCNAVRSDIDSRSWDESRYHRPFGSLACCSRIAQSVIETGRYLFHHSHPFCNLLFHYFFFFCFLAYF